MTKVCTKCGEEKSLVDFSNRSAAKDGKNPWCRACVRDSKRKYYQDNRDKISERNREYYQANQERIISRSSQYYEEHKEQIAETCHNYYVSNKEKIRDYNSKYYKNNKDKIIANVRQYRDSNREVVLGRKLEYEKKRRASDPLFAVARRCRARINHALNGHGFSKKATTKEMLGCTFEELMSHLESQFVDGMSWDNRSEWHIDHIVPLASAESEAELMALCHYTNLQPLWAEDNRRKSARLDWAA